MAESKTTTVAPGVTRDDHFWGYDLTGTKEALLASGLAKEEWFWNGRRASDGRRLTTVHFKIDGNRAKCWQSHQVEGEYYVNVSFSKEEVEKGREGRQRELAARDARDAHIRGVGSTLLAFNAENNPEYLWSFPAATIEEVKQHLREIMQLFEDGGLALRPGSTVQFDAHFQRFMQRATSEAGEQRPDAGGTA